MNQKTQIFVLDSLEPTLWSWGYLIFVYLVSSTEDTWIINLSHSLILKRQRKNTCEQFQKIQVAELLQKAKMIKRDCFDGPTCWFRFNSTQMTSM